MEDVIYSPVGQYEAVVSILETLRYCSDAEHPLRIAEIYVRCEQFTTNWLGEKVLQRGLKALLEAGKSPSWVAENGGYVVAVPLGKNVNGYYWEKNDTSGMAEKILRKGLQEAGMRDICRELLDKLGLNADMRNEEKWRKAESRRDRLDMAHYISVKTPYTAMILDRECRMGWLG